ncbi:hypothetical protein NDU88_005518 [Pleurodeles waltl]|uniref:Uncharacterized protein n=1 Tax=Pleurodeles waltl TaxID=8319 RepID=A0AAV7MWK4_PLEWA|nr:hypothetical protein NDU88_005518 [Pleurodeles waltl]
MVYYTDEEEQYQELQEVPAEHQGEERLVEALGHHVQDSVNWALIRALKPFTQPMTNFGRRELLGEGSQQACSHIYEPLEVSGLPLQRSGGSSSAEILAQMAASVLHDHEYRENVLISRSPTARRMQIPGLVQAPFRGEAVRSGTGACGGAGADPKAGIRLPECWGELLDSRPVPATGAGAGEVRWSGAGPGPAEARTAEESAGSGDWSPAAGVLERAPGGGRT